MSDRIRGNLREFDFKEYGPEDAGQKIGWSTLEPNPDGDSFYLRGAYAVVGPEGASVPIIERTDNGERLWHTGMTRGLTRACSYAILIDPNRDVRLMNTDFAQLDLESADHIAGGVYHMHRDIDDEQIVWGKGESELTGVIKDVLDEQGAGDMYPYAYLSINGRLGHDLYFKNRHSILGGVPTLRGIAEIQLYDPEMEDVVKSDMNKAGAQNVILNKWAIDGESMENDIESRIADAELFEVFRNRVKRFHDRIDLLQKSMVAPVVTYTREGFTRTWPFMSATDSDVEINAVQNGNFGRAAVEVEREADEVRARQRHVLQGAHILLALTASGRERAAQES